MAAKRTSPYSPESSKLDAGPFTFFVATILIFLLAGITNFFISSSSKPLTSMLLEGFRQKELQSTIVLWLVGLIVLISVFLVIRILQYGRNKEAPLWQKTLTIFFALVMGWFTGSNTIALWIIDENVKSLSSTTQQYNVLGKHIMAYKYFESPEARNVWFTEDEQLRAEKKEAWCTNARAQLDAYKEMNVGFQYPNVELRALLLKASYTDIYVKGCLSHEEMISRMNSLFEVARQGNYQDIMSERWSFIAPVMSLMDNLTILAGQRVMFTAKNMCTALQPKDFIDTKDHHTSSLICQKFADNRLATEQDVPAIEKAWKEAMSK